MYIHVLVHTFTYMRLHVRTCTHAYIRVRTCTYVCIHVHTCTYMCVHVHTHTWPIKVYSSGLYAFTNALPNARKLPIELRDELYLWELFLERPRYVKPSISHSPIPFAPNDSLPPMRVLAHPSMINLSFGVPE